MTDSKPINLKLPKDDGDDGITYTYNGQLITFSQKTTVVLELKYRR